MPTNSKTLNELKAIRSSLDNFIKQREGGSTNPSEFAVYDDVEWNPPRTDRHLKATVLQKLNGGKYWIRTASPYEGLFERTVPGKRLTKL